MTNFEIEQGRTPSSLLDHYKLYVSIAVFRDPDYYRKEVLIRIPLL